MNLTADGGVLQTDLVRIGGSSPIAGLAAAEILVLRHQLNILRHRSSKRPRLNNFDRLIFAGVYSMAPNGLSALAIVKPGAHQQVHRGHSVQRRRVVHSRAENVRLFAEDASRTSVTKKEDRPSSLG